MFKLMHTRRRQRCEASAQTPSLMLESLLQARRSVRKFSDTPLEFEQVSQLVWAAQGIVGEAGNRTTPSAGALYPLNVHAVIGAVEGLPPGLYKYHPKDHTLNREREIDLREALCATSFGQESVRDAPVDIVITSGFETTTGRYHERGLRYVYMEAGHAAQNVYLLATALKLGTVAIGAFDDELVGRVLALPHDEHPLYIMPIGHRHMP